MIIDNFAKKCHVAITIIDKSKVALSDNDSDKNLSIDNYRAIIIADSAHHWVRTYSNFCNLFMFYFTCIQLNVIN